MLYSFKSIYLQERLGNWDCSYIRKNKNLWMWWHDGSVNFVWVLLLTFGKPFQFLTEHYLLILFWGLYFLPSCFKILYLSDWIVWFQNGCNKVVSELPVMLQSRSEIIPVISNKICAEESFDFEMMCLISDLIIYVKKLLGSDWLRQIRFSGNSVQKRVNSVQRR